MSVSHSEKSLPIDEIQLCKFKHKQSYKIFMLSSVCFLGLLVQCRITLKWKLHASVQNNSICSLCSCCLETSVIPLHKQHRWKRSAATNCGLQSIVHDKHKYLQIQSCSFIYMNLCVTVDLQYNAIPTSKPNLTLSSQKDFFFTLLVLTVILKNLNLLNFFRSIQAEQVQQTEDMI